MSMKTKFLLFYIFLLIFIPIASADKVDDYILKGNQLVKDRRYGDAVKEYEKVLDANANNAQVHLLLGMTYAEMKNYDKALQYTRKASELDPSYPAFYHMGLIYAAKKDIPKALESLEKALKINPESYMAHYQKGLVHTAKKDYVQAMEHYKKAIELNPYFDEAYPALAGVYYETGDKASALKLVDDLRAKQKKTLADGIESWIQEKEKAGKI